MKNNISEFFKPIFQNGEEITPQKWINSFLFLVGVQFLWFVIEIFVSFNLSNPFELTLSIIVLLYIIAMCVLIFQKHKWGWILLFAEKLLTGIGSMIYLVIVISSEYFIQEEMSSLFWGIFISILFISYLVKKEVYSHFMITKKNKDLFIKRISTTVIAIFTIGIVLTFLYI